MIVILIDLEDEHNEYDSQKVVVVDKDHHYPRARRGDADMMLKGLF